MITIEKISNKVIYNFKLNKLLDLVAASLISKLKSFIIRINTINILIFININVKHYYNKYYTSIFFKKESLILLYLYKEYNIFINISITKKLR